MARCGCAGQTCSCLIQGGDGIDVSGSGTVNDPYVIATGGIDIGGSIQFVDTDTVDFTVTGQGTEAAPYQISAVATVGVSDLTDVGCNTPSDGSTLVWDAGANSWVCGVPAIALDDLTDVDATTPNDNEVLTWNGTAWVPAVVSVEPGQVNTSHGATGDGTATNPVGVDTPVEWADLSPVLEGEGGQTQDGGLPTYIDSTGAVRVPRGFYAYMAPNADINTLPPDSLLWNDADLLLGDRASEDLRAVVFGRAVATGRSSTVMVHNSQLNNYAAGRIAIKEFADADAEETLLSSALLIGVRGNLNVQSDVTGELVGRPIPFAQEAGLLTFGSIPAGSSVGVTITLPANRFTATPRVMATVHTSLPHARNAGTANISTSSFMLYCGNMGTQTATGIVVDWHAIQTQNPPAVGAPVQGPRNDVVPVNPMIATCDTLLCENNGVPIEVSTGWLDEETGQVDQVDQVICGACGNPITDLVEVS